MTAHDVDVIGSQVLQHSFRSPSSVRRSPSDISVGVSTSIPSLRTILFCGTAGSGSAPLAIHCVFTVAVVQVIL